MDKQKVYYASHIGTFELDAITGLVPNPVKPGSNRPVDLYSIRVMMGANSAVLVLASEVDRDGWRTRIEQEMGIVHDVAPALDGLDIGIPIGAEFADEPANMNAGPVGVPVGAQGISGVEMAAQLRASTPQSVERARAAGNDHAESTLYADMQATSPADIGQAVVAAVQHANRDEPAVPVPDIGFDGMGTEEGLQRRRAAGLSMGGPETAEPDPAQKKVLGYCVMVGCLNNAGEGSIVCRTHADTLNNTGRVDA